MKVLLAKNSGFCFGVRRAVEMAEALANERGTVYTYGHIIHNRTLLPNSSRKVCAP
jgi:4-hydroxy-3-methylbut-2-enyl diphosphate reductase